ncbi:MAG: OmpH family outer membrane protein [Planctomycetota bacterium]
MIRQQAKLICLLAAVTLGAGSLLLPGQRTEAQAPAKAAPTAVAVVNVAELIAKSAENVAFQAEVQKRQVKLQAEQKKKQDAINVLRTNLDLAGNAAERQKMERDITKALFEFQAWQQIEQQNLLREQRLFLIELYGKIDAAVSAVAQREGYDLVLFDTPTPDFNNLTPEQLIQVIGNRRIVYRADKVNLTPTVLAKLDRDYQNRGAE